MAKTKEISRRIKSVTSTKKITRAMEMVAATKMRKAVEAVLKTRVYADLSWKTILNLFSALKEEDKGYQHPLLAKREQIKKIGVILITSNRGLCGNFNSAIINKAHDRIAKQNNRHEADAKVEFILVGKKGGVIYRHGHEIVAEFPKLDLATEVKEIIPVVKFIVDKYLSGDYDKILVAYTDFVNPAKQVPRIKQLLPIDISKEDEYLGVTERGKDAVIVNIAKDKFKYEYIFEPNPKKVLDEIIPRLMEVQLYQALLESNASEHSARMTAMHQATEAASDMVAELTLFYNKARQAGITAEIAEISAGANALAE